MKKYAITMLFILALFSCNGSGQWEDSSGTQEDAALWFEEVTGLELSKEVEIIGANRFEALGSIHVWIKMKVPKDFAELLKMDFNKRDEKFAKALKPLDEWAKQMPYWNNGEIDGSEFYDRKTGKHIAIISYNRETGVIHLTSLGKEE